MSDFWFTTLVFLLEFSVRLCAAVFVLLRGPRRPSATLAWVIVILSLPVVGILAYLTIGEVRLGSRRIRRHSEIVDQTRLKVASARHPEAKIDGHFQSTATLAGAVGGMAPRGGNEVRLMGDTEQVIDALVADIDAAEVHCHLLFYIYLDDGTGRKVGNALQRAAARAVECRLLVDSVGSHAFLKSSLRDDLVHSGVRVVGALPANLLRAAFSRIDLRNHRKIAVIDGAIGYTGSQNIADASFAPKPKFAPWVDAMLRISGPAVRDLQELFVADWFLDSDESIVDVLAVQPRALEGGVVVQIIPTGPDCYNQALQQLALAAFHLAREELILTTPYFVPGEAEIASLCTAARRGVRTCLVVPARNDSVLVGAASRAHYRELLDAGVQICEYTHGLLHAKTLTIDRSLALVSTANFDRRSFELNFEVSSLVYDSDFASQLRFLQRSYIEASREVDSARWKRRKWYRRLGQNAAGALSPLL